MSLNKELLKKNYNIITDAVVLGADHQNLQLMQVLIILFIQSSILLAGTTQKVIKTFSIELTLCIFKYLLQPLCYYIYTTVFPVLYSVLVSLFFNHSTVSGLMLAKFANTRQDTIKTIKTN